MIIEAKTLLHIRARLTQKCYQIYVKCSSMFLKIYSKNRGGMQGYTLCKYIDECSEFGIF